MKEDKYKEESYLMFVWVGIFIGDINGIGLEVVIKVLVDMWLLFDCMLIIYVFIKILVFYKKFFGDFEFNY